MVLDPEVQKKAHELMDRVIRDQRLPIMENEMDLQYLHSPDRQGVSLLGVYHHHGCRAPRRQSR